MYYIITKHKNQHFKAQNYFLLPYKNNQYLHLIRLHFEIKKIIIIKYLKQLQKAEHQYKPPQFVLTAQIGVV